MPSFPEESLDAPVGYFAGQPGGTLNNGRWTITRKLGWGPHSSTWLAVDSEDANNIEAIKIFTVAASKDSLSTNERDLLQGPLKDKFQSLPSLRSSFYEESVKGKHLALVFHVLGSSVESYRTAAGGSLPVPIVKKIAAGVLEPLVDLHKKNIVHGAVTANNILFAAPQQGAEIKALLEASPSAPVEEVVGADGATYKAVKSQPFAPGSAEEVADQVFYLSNLENARQVQDNVAAKEDIKSLGATVYLLLTGTPLSSEKSVEELLSSNGKVSKEDIPSAAAFIKAALTGPSASALVGNEWVL